MLQSLTIKNLALFKNQNIEFHKGLNILLGETGSGKSLVFDAISFVLGINNDKTLLRSGENQTKVDALFSQLNESTTNLLKTYDIFEDEILITRTLSLDGRSSYRVNGEPATASMVKNIGKTLVDSMVQHESVELLKSKNHLMMIDKFGGSDISSLKDDILDLFSKKKEIEKKIASLGGSDESRERTLQLLLFQIDEIEKAELEIGEDDSIKERLDLMDNAEKIMEVSLLADKNLSNGSLSAVSLISDVISSLNSLPKTDLISECSDRLLSLRYDLEDVSQTLGALKNTSSYDEIEYNRLDSRLDLIKSLKKKYGKTIGEILSYLDEIKTKYNDLIDSDELIIKLSNEKKKIEEDIKNICLNLSKKRKEFSKIIEEKITKELKDLGMKDTLFKVEFKEKDLSVDGFDDVEFIFSANKGQDLKSLAKTASGGEASRLMLALKTIFSAIDGVDTLIFDEVDSGISGEVGNMIAKKLEWISKTAQIFCITHLPQVAAISDHFYVVKKEVFDDSTQSSITEVDEETGVKEIAKLIEGNKLSDLSLKHALEIRKKIKSN